MKNILLILLLIVSFNAFGQVPTGYQYRRVNERIEGSFMVDSAFNIPRYTDTTAANLHKRSDSCGAMFFSYTKDSVYYRACNPKRWITVGSGGGTMNAGVTGKPAYYVGATTLDDFTPIDYATSGTHALITAQSATDVPLNVKGASLQTANIQNWSSSAGTADLASLTKDGYFQSIRGGFGVTPTHTFDVASADLLAAYVTSSNGAATRVGINHASNTGFGLYIGGVSKWSIAANDFYGTGTPAYSIHNDALTQHAFSINASNNNVSIGGESSAPVRKLSVTEHDAVTNNITYVQRMTHKSSGTVAAGFGTGSEVELENASGNLKVVAAFETIYTDATDGSEDNDYIIRLVSGGTGFERFRVTSQGGVVLQEVAAPSTPASATAVMYVKSDGLFYGKDDAGVETKLSNDAGGTPTLQQVLDAGSTLSSTEQIAVGANQLQVNGSATALQVGSSGDGSAALNVYNEASSTNTSISILRLQRATTGTAANGLGGKIQFDAQTTAGIVQVSSLDWTLQNATHANRTSQIGVTGFNNALEDTLMRLGGYVNLTESSATKFTSTTIGTGQIQGGSIVITVEANDATDFQARTLRFIWSAVNKAGTITATISAVPEEVVSTSAVSTLTVTITVVDAGSGVLDFKANAVSSLSQSTLRCSYQTFKNF